MSKMKKVLLMCTAYVLVAALAIGGTIAYLTSTDSDVNVMTLGNVKIEQHEYERVVDADGNYKTIETDRGTGYELQDFTQNKPLYPSQNQEDTDWDSTQVNLDQLGKGSRGAMDVFTNKLAQDKFVFVENTGKSDAYVRTLIAFELGSVDVADWSSLIMTSNHFTWDDPEMIGVIDIEGNNYVVIEYVYKGYTSHHAGGVLPAGELTYNSLAQVYMTADATNEDVEALDGNSNGTYDIFVLSQAVQTAGFSDPATALDAGFGDSTVVNAAEWFKGMTIASIWDGSVDTSWYSDEEDSFVLDTAEQLAGLSELVSEGKTFAGKTVALGMDVNLANIEWTPVGNWNNSVFSGVFNGQGHTIQNLTIAKTNASGTERLGLFGYIKNATIQNLTVEGAEITADAKTARGAVLVMCADGASNTISGITIKDSSVTMKSAAQTYACGVVAWANAGTSMNMGDITVSNLTLTASQTDSSFAKVASVMGYLYNADGKASCLDGFDVSNVIINVTSPKASVGGVLADTNKGSLKVLNGNVSDVVMTVNGSGEKDIGGVVGYTYKVDHLTVENVAVNNCDIDFSGSSSRVGGVTGWDQSVSDYKKVTVSGSINENITTGSGSEVGGFVGISYYYPKTYNGCSSDVDVVTGGVAGGFVGTSCTNGWANQTDAYTDCIARGDVAADTAGGFVGKGWLTNNTTLALTNVESHGSVTGKYQAGGLLGGAWQNNKGGNVVIKNYVASKNVVGTTSTTLVGEIVGDKWVNNFTVEN